MEITRGLSQLVSLAQANQEPASDIELKKHAEQAKRFGNDAFKHHAQLSQVKGALQTLQPDQLLKLLKSTMNTVSGYSTRTPLDNQELPHLKAPASSASDTGYSASGEKLSASAWATALLGKVMQLTAESSMSNLMAKLQGINASVGGGVTAYSEMAARLEQQGIQFASDFDALNAATRQEKDFLHSVSQARSALGDAQNGLADLEAEAATAEPVSDTLLASIDAAKKAVTGAQASLTLAVNAHNHFTRETLIPAITAEKNSRAALAAAQVDSHKLVNSFNSQQQTAIETQRKQSDEQAKSLTFMMALMSQLINKSSSDDLQATAELKQKLAEVAAKDAEKKAKEYEEQVRKAEEMQKTMGCIGKIVGWAITVVSVAAAAFTGGASLALAAVGLALAIGDEISQAVSGRSFMADAMQPLMDSVIKPLMDLLGPILSSLLQSLGVDKESADMAGQILAAIAAAAALVAAMTIAGDIVSKVGSKVMETIGSNVTKEASKAIGKNVAVGVQKEVVKDVTQNVMRTAVKEVAEEVGQEVAEKAARTIMQRLMDSTVSQVLKRLSKGVGRSIGADDLQIAKVSNYSQKGVLVATTANTGSQAVVGIITANMMVEASKAKADMMNDAALQDLLNEMMDRAIDSFTQRMESMNEIVRNLSSIAESQAQAGQFITRQMKSVAG